MDKVVATAGEAVADVPDGASLAVGGFGLSGVPNVLIQALYERGVSGLSVVSNNCGAMESGLAVLLAAGRIARVTGSYIGANKEFARQYLAGELEVELIPQGTLAERLRAGGAGIPAFYTPAAVGTELAEGRETRIFNGREYLLEEALPLDYAFIRATQADEAGNLRFRRSQRNFNPLMAMAARVTIVEVEEDFLPRGAIDPDDVHLPGIYVHRMVKVPPPPEGWWPMRPADVARYEAEKNR
jgi:3-oxoacid CoA-transferase subunit A